MTSAITERAQQDESILLGTATLLTGDDDGSCIIILEDNSCSLGQARALLEASSVTAIIDPECKHALIYSEEHHETVRQVLRAAGIKVLDWTDDCAQPPCEFSAHCGNIPSCCIAHLHVVIWEDGGKIALSPDRGQEQMVPQLAGLLALAGIPFTSKEDEENRALVVEPQDRAAAVTTLVQSKTNHTIIPS